MVVVVVAVGGGRGGVASILKALTLDPTLQICPVLYHAGMVLLNSLLDTVPGELALAGWRAPGHAWGWNGGEEEAGYAAGPRLRVGPCHALGSHPASAADLLLTCGA